MISTEISHMTETDTLIWGVLESCDCYLNLRMNNAEMDQEGVKVVLNNFFIVSYNLFYKLLKILRKRYRCSNDTTHTLVMQAKELAKNTTVETILCDGGKTIRDWSVKILLKLPVSYSARSTHPLHSHGQLQWCGEIGQKRNYSEERLKYTIGDNSTTAPLSQYSPMNSCICISLPWLDLCPLLSIPIAFVFSSPSNYFKNQYFLLY